MNRISDGTAYRKALKMTNVIFSWVSKERILERVFLTIVFFAYSSTAIIVICICKIAVEDSRSTLPAV
jgi:hypothetical protein